MIKKNKLAAEPVAKKKKSRKKSSRKKMDPARVREELAGIVKSEAKSITAAVMGQAMQGELAPAKYLLEMAGVFPATNDGEQTTEEEDCLAKTLLQRLNAPRKAAKREVGETKEQVTDSGDEDDNAKESVVG